MSWVGHDRISDKLYIFFWKKQVCFSFFWCCLKGRWWVPNVSEMPLWSTTHEMFFFLKSISRWSCRCSIFPLNFGIFHHLYRLVFLKLVLGCLVGPASNSNQFSQRVFVRRKAPTIFFQFHTSFQGGGKMVRLLVKERILWEGSISHFHGWGRSTSF